MKNLWIASLFLLCSATIYSQYTEIINSNRPSPSESPFSVGTDVLQFETGFFLEQREETVFYDASSFGSNLSIRYGISKNVEVDAEVNLITAKDKTAQPQNTTGIEPAMLGVNYLLLSESKSQPAIILSAQLAFPFMATKNLSANYLAPLLQANLQKPVNKKLALGVSGGAFWDGFVTTASFIYNANATYTFSKKWMAVSEWFGFINGGLSQHNTDLSITYSFNKNVQLGITAGTGISDAAHKSYISINGVWGCSMKRKRSVSAIH